MNVCSRVMAVFAANGGPVHFGSPSLQLDTYLEDLFEARAKAKQAIRNARSTQYSGPELDLLRNLAKLAVDIAKESVKQLTPLHLSDTKRAEVGLATPFDIVTDEIKFARAKMELDRAVTQRKQLEMTVLRLTQMDELAHKLSTDELNFISGRRDRMKIYASMEGQVKLMVNLGSFAKRGSVLAEIS